MAVIPPDAGVRMRLQAESSLVQPLQPVKPIPGDLPDLQPGQAFTARIVEALPDNTFRAMVAGRQFTLQLPEGAEPGDTLELVVVDRTPKSIIAQRAEPASAPAVSAQPYPYAKISTAGRIIGELMLPEGEAPQPAPLTRGQPLVPQPPVGQGLSAADLAPALAKAVSQSGLFYESHQAQWVAGQRTLDSLRAEPQGRIPASPPTAAPEQPGGTEAVRLPLHAAERAAVQTAAAAPAVPDEIRPIVQQQLDAVVTQRLAWHGEAWPGQQIDWKIERQSVDEHGAGQTGEEAPHWATTLRLTMPNLGALDATLKLAGGRLQLQVSAASDAAAESLRGQLPDLAQALEHAGVPLQSAEIRGEAA